MLALVVLFTIFVGLVGLLAAIGECQKRRRSSAEKRRERVVKETLARVKGWLAGHGLDVPSGGQIMALLNSSLKQVPSKEWQELKLEDLSTDNGGSLLPSLTITSISAEDKDKIQFECKLEDLPVVGVACVNEAGERVSCRVEVEWIYAKTQVTLHLDEGGRLLVSVHHTQPAKMSLACATQGNVKDGERLSSSVADDLQVWFSSLTITDVAMTTLIPSLLVSDHDHQEEKEGAELTTPIPTETPPPLADGGTIIDQNIEPPLSTIISDDNTGVSPERTAEDEYKGQVSVSEESGLLNNGYYYGKQEGEGGGEREGEDALNGDNNSIGRQNSASGQPEEEENKVPLEEGVHPLTLPSVREEGEGEGERGSSRCGEADTAAGTAGLPTSPTWRRSPSYEQLQQIELDPHRLVKSSRAGTGSSLRASPPHSSDRRALTLSVSGSEAESIYGADERIPSTLVFEVADSPNKLRHIVAVTPVHAIKLRRRYPHAKKLHIYNDHCFTATHIKKRTECVVCGSKISGLFGKQAYMCQDCHTVVHKQCHFKVDGQCSGTQLQNMNLIYPDNTSTASAN